MKWMEMNGKERKVEARMLWNEIKKFWQYRSLIVILILGTFAES